MPEPESDGFDFEFASEVADKYLAILEPFCERIEIAGSVRRNRAKCHDIDLVLILDQDKFDEFQELVDGWDKIRGQADGKNIWRGVPEGIMLDITMCSHDNFGWKMVVRTGPIGFYLTLREQLLNHDRDFPEEADVFNCLDMEFVEAPDRDNYFEANMAKKGEVRIAGPIGESFFEDGITDKMVQKQIDDLGNVDEIRFVINSPGGNLFDGLGIFNIIARQKAKTITEVAGLAGSAAALFAVAADEVEAGEVSSFFIHNTQGLAMGDRNDMTKTAEIMGKFDSIARKAFMKKTGLPEAKIDKMMNAETNLTAEEAKEMGFVDRLIAVRDDVEAVETDKEDLAKEVDAMLKDLRNNSDGFYKLAASAEGVLGKQSPRDVLRGGKLAGGMANLHPEPYLMDFSAFAFPVAILKNINSVRFHAAFYSDPVARLELANRKDEYLPDSKIELTDGQNVFLYSEKELTMWHKVQAELGVDSPDDALTAVQNLKASSDNSVLVAELKTTKESLGVVTAQLKADAESRIADAKAGRVSRLEALRDEGYILPAEVETYQPIAENDVATFDALEANWRSRDPQHKKLTNSITDPSNAEPDPKTDPVKALAKRQKDLVAEGKCASLTAADNWIRENEPKLYAEYEAYVSAQMTSDG